MRNPFASLIARCRAWQEKRRFKLLGTVSVPAVHESILLGTEWTATERAEFYENGNGKRRVVMSTPDLRNFLPEIIWFESGWSHEKVFGSITQRVKRYQNPSAYTA